MFNQQINQGVNSAWMAQVTQARINRALAEPEIVNQTRRFYDAPPLLPRVTDQTGTRAIINLQLGWNP